MTFAKKPIFRWLASVMLALAAGAAMAHGDVVPQAVDTSDLKQIGSEWVKVNPYRGDKRPSASVTPPSTRTVRAATA